MSNRKNRHIPLNIELYHRIKVLAAKQGKNANDLIEEGMKMVLTKYGELKKEPIQKNSNE